MNFKRVTLTGLLALALAFSANAQVNAIDFAYGTGTVAPLRVIGGPYTAGVSTITVSQGYTVSAAGVTFNPLSTAALIRIGSGTSQESVTPSAVSCSTPTQYGTCNFTATFTNTHGTGDLVQSATFGAQEAVAYQVSLGGGEVVLNRAWTRAGGTDAVLAALAASSQVALVDKRGPTKYWSMQPTTLTLLAAPAVLDATSATWTATPAGTWTAAAHYLCVTYVDALGGEGPCSPTYNVTPTVSYTLHIASPAASTGAVGWRAYAGANYAGAYLLPIVTGNCTLTALESVMPACAIGAAGTWSAIFVNTTQLKPAPATPLENVNNIVPQGHTTFAYQPLGGNPVPFQSNYGPFAAVGAITAGNYAVLGTVQLPSGYLNYIGRTVRISGKITATSTTADTYVLRLLLGWVGGTTAGLGTVVCTMAETGAMTLTAVNVPFSCTLTTNAVGATAIGSLMPSGWMLPQITAGTTVGVVANENSVAAVGSLGLFAQNTISVSFGSIAQASSAAQLLELHVETL